MNAPSGFAARQQQRQSVEREQRSRLARSSRPQLGLSGWSSAAHRQIDQQRQAESRAATRCATCISCASAARSQTRSVRATSAEQHVQPAPASTGRHPRVRPPFRARLRPIGSRDAQRSARCWRADIKTASRRAVTRHAGVHALQPARYAGAGPCGERTACAAPARAIRAKRRPIGGPLVANARVPTSCWHASRPSEEQAKRAPSSRSSSAPRPASARRTRMLVEAHERHAGRAWTLVAGLGRDARPQRDRGTPRGSRRSFPAGPLADTRGTRLEEFDRRRRARTSSPAPCCSWTSWRTRTPRARATPSAGRTSRSCSTPGIDVYTTLNVQHVESLIRRRRRDHRRPVARDRARLRSSIAPTRSSSWTCRPTTCCSASAKARSTCPSRPARAVENFFRKGNLIALRELALRRWPRASTRRWSTTAARRASRSAGRWAALIVGRRRPAASAARLVRAARRLAEGFKAEWVRRCTSSARRARARHLTRDHLVGRARLRERSWAPRLRSSPARA